MTAFRHCLEDCDLFYLGYVGYQYTWTNKQTDENNIQERLDRGVANELWRNKFPAARVFHLTRVLSDHCPIHVNWSGPR